MSYHGRYSSDLNQPFRRSLSWFCIFLILTVCLPSSFFAQSSARTVPRSLDQLTAEADLIVHGYVTSARFEPHPQLRNLMTVVVTMRIAETYKGPPRKTITFRQYVWDLNQQKAAAGDYGKGQELLLLLRPVSEYGLTSPVGLEQGRFLISRDHLGNVTALNGRGNVGLFNSVAQRAQTRGLHLSPHTLAVAQQHRAGPIKLNDLKEAIRSFVGTR